MATLRFVFQYEPREAWAAGFKYHCHPNTKEVR